MGNIKRRTTAWTLAWLCVLVTVYASLYPFEDWRNQDIAPWSFVTAPWPKYLTPFDVWSNLLGYLPLGFWLCLAAIRTGTSRGPALLLSLALTCSLSFTLESLQSFLPVRVPSQVDWLCNSLGGLMGALLAAVLERRGWLYHWVQFRRNWLLKDASGSLVLMVLWPLAILFPSAVPLGLGHVLERVRANLLQEFPSWLWLQQIPPDGFFQTLSPRMEMLCVALGLWIPALLGFSVLRGQLQRLTWLVCVGMVAVIFNALSAALTYGPEHAWFWVNAQVFGGLALGLLLSMLTIKLRLIWSLLLMVIAQLLLLIWLNQLTASTYLEQTVQTWEQGRFIRFHGLTQWLSWLWPWALLAWGMVGLLRYGFRRTPAT
jgi:VanZ family protein